MTNPEKRSTTSSNSIKKNPEPASSGNTPDIDLESIGNRFPKAFRLSGRDAYATVFERGLVATDATLVVHALTNDLTFTRLGLSISKKVGTAPTRNYWKRCIREAFRRNRSKLPTSLDIIVRPRRGAKPDYDAIENALTQLLKRLSRQLNKT